jgi:hypothetical protein
MQVQIIPSGFQSRFFAIVQPEFLGALGRPAFLIAQLFLAALVFPIFIKQLEASPGPAQATVFQESKTSLFA